jgi:Tol biopolymer transport system component
MKKILVALFTLFFLTKCMFFNDKHLSPLGGFDISKDDKQIVFSFYLKNGISIYNMNIDGSDLKNIVISDKIWSFFNPKYSADGKKIVFVGYKKELPNSRAIFIANSDGTNIQQITKGNEIINEAIFSKCENEILYTKANEYGKYSPLGKEQPHGIDVFSINITNKEIKQITNLNTYALYDISEIDCNKLLMFIYAGEDGGMFIYTKDSIKKLNRIVPVNEKVKPPEAAYKPIFSRQFNMFAFTTSYQLYVMDVNTKKSQMIYDNFSTKPDVAYLMGSICFFYTDKRILFQKNNDFNLYSINFDGKNLKKIPINIK